MENIFDNLVLDVWEPTINIGDLLKAPLIVILIGVLLYAFLLLLKVRILVDTVESEGNFRMKVLVSINLFVTILACVLGTIIILLG